MIAARFKQLKEQDELALMPYLVAGFPDLDRSVERLHQLLDSGADLIELGIPFCDPVADGPTIQRASQAALDGGVTLTRILDALEGHRFERPVTMMSYLNPLLSFGREALLDRLAALGLAGLIIPDLPVEEAEEWTRATRDRGLSLTLLVAPTSGDERVRRIADSSDGFLYYVSVTGVTGTRQELPTTLHDELARVRRLTDRPVAVGFGISTPEHVRGLRGHAAGAVVGSRVVQAIENDEDLPALIRELKLATRAQGV